jgi:hypothetical protein
MRQKHQLTQAELAEWRNLSQDNGEEDRAMDAWVFWNRVCLARNLDSGSLLAGPTPEKFSALPSTHDLDWCYPTALRCTRPPPPFEAPVPIREASDA